MANKKNIDENIVARLGTVGGQAVMEGVMMKCEKNIAITVRREDGEMVSKKREFKSIRSKSKIFNIPILRGFINFIDMMALSMSTLNESMEMLGLEEQLRAESGNDSKKTDSAEEKGADKDKNKDKEKKDTSWVMIASVLGVVLGLGLSFLLFFFLPTFVGKQIAKAVNVGWFLNLIEGILKLLIFVLYISAVSLMKDIRRTFEYHGAEHMSVFCYESGEELTVENVKKHSRFHPRCGTSFMIVMMIVGVAISSVIPLSFGVLARTAVKLSLFPLVIGIGFEFIKYAGKHNNLAVKIVSAPGLWVQRLSTKPPDDKQIEVAIASLKLAVANEKSGYVQDSAAESESGNDNNKDNDRAVIRQ